MDYRNLRGKDHSMITVFGQQNHISKFDHILRRIRVCGIGIEIIQNKKHPSLFFNSSIFSLSIRNQKSKISDLQSVVRPLIGQRLAGAVSLGERSRLAPGRQQNGLRAMFTGRSKDENSSQEKLFTRKT